MALSAPPTLLGRAGRGGMYSDILQVGGGGGIHDGQGRHMREARINHKGYQMIMTFILKFEKWCSINQDTLIQSFANGSNSTYFSARAEAGLFGTRGL